MKPISVAGAESIFNIDGRFSFLYLFFLCSSHRQKQLGGDSLILAISWQSTLFLKLTTVKTKTRKKKKKQWSTHFAETYSAFLTLRLYRLPRFAQRTNQFRYGFPVDRMILHFVMAKPARIHFVATWRLQMRKRKFCDSSKNTNNNGHYCKKANKDKNSSSKVHQCKAAILFGVR